MRPLPHSVVVPLTLHHSVWLTPCTWTSGWEHRGAHRRTESRDPATIRGGVEPQAMNWSLEPAGSQSETGPTHELASSWGAGSCFSGRNPHGRHDSPPDTASTGAATAMAHPGGHRGAGSHGVRSRELR